MLEYIGKIIWKLIAKSILYVGILLCLCSIVSMLIGSSFIVSGLIGLIGVTIISWMIIAYNKRAYSRGIVYSYTLENGLYLPRLTDEPDLKITKTKDGWNLRDKSYKQKGFVKRLEVSKTKYLLVYWLLWGWVDDDCRADTVAREYGQDIIDGKNLKFLQHKSLKFILNKIKKEQAKVVEQPDGTVFSLGNNVQPFWVPILSTLWMFRNLAYNFNYSQEEIRENDPNNFYIKFPRLGWHFGYIPYSNSERKGRMVWFTEDYDKLDKK